MSIKADTDFLLESNWPTLGQGNHSVASKLLFEWCGSISKFLLSLSERLVQIENKETDKSNEIIK